MKVITSKELQINRAAILKDVQAGQEYQITFHRRPIAKLIPMHKSVDKKPARGSYEAILESLKYTKPANSVPPDADLEEIRWQHMKKEI